MMAFRASPALRSQIIKASEIAMSKESSTADATEIMRQPTTLFSEHIIKLQAGEIDANEAARAYLALLSEYTSIDFGKTASDGESAGDEKAR